ncbi:uncharacterized protein LOC105840624 isoform X2 [Monomorium pharaonis]|uniref:uncharacterized protein LOC105840624 isoform X2 n=1 Tax=Monomorium pharaonis TaxID=307658 RepID=UPI00063F7AAE|nr:uncharacterized protein LOC105840624 isoform X2 [Monomorium pharaonis]
MESVCHSPQASCTLSVPVRARIRNYILAKDVKEFVICLFDTGLHLVPKLWFVPNSFKFVLFPSYKTEMRIIKAIQNKEIPQNNDLWEVHQVKRIMESYDDFPKAWNKFKKACFFSDTPSEDTDVKRTKRKEYAKEVDSDVTLCEDSDIPRPPKLKKKCNNFERAQFCLENTLDVIKSDKENVKALSPIPTDPLRIPTNVDKNVDESMSSDNDISNDNVDDNVLLQRTDEILSKIGTIAGDELVDENLFINSDLKEINVNQLIQVLKNLSNQISLLVAEDRKKTKILTEIQEELHQIRKKEIELETNEEFNILNTLPLATEQQILEMERFLLYKRNENQLHQILQEIGGSNPTEMTRKIMNTLFTLELCTKYTLKGKRTNKNNFSTLKVCRVIEKVVIKKGNTTLTEIHKVIENWLIRAKDKLMRKETNASAHSIIVAQEIKDEMDIYECL